mmetsp:Transcript_372/g.634  ORF Transcript_372/g.634 Transcript_372/m.634 type:complete len:394 (-) Transcript_372:86-1267(-)|eukprot:CAMPEP_0201533092 /NCGR_PEP_ID=MMETSP0161_2-20130828/52155_1 /ASSEMBLY_ACC=CAM_ASM_000251 /TAXON_ID=180227 /ORGANISM="Neoparamoeba aestuarina, Strain SoJaBio B1-5/56/2" /LENGTH=393 /DNA_ID=CAMNT_0047936891 /DNA_START=13 /DNA_END=1194 /DNA_ORIENTATION=+
MAAFRGFLIDDREKFLEDEEKASIFLLNGGCEYLKNKENSDKVIEKIQKWPAIVDISETDRQQAREILSAPCGEIARIILNDVERVFAAKHNQEQLARFTSKIHKHWSDYAQSMTYVAATLLLALPEEETFCILDRLNSKDKYLPGHWKPEASGYATDAFISWRFLSDEKNGVSEVPKHLSTYLIKPNSLFQKYMQGLGLHLFPLECAVEYIEHFLRQGITFLWHFHIVLFKWLKSALLGLDRIDLILALLRLEKSELDTHELSYTPSQFFELIEKASKMTVLDPKELDIPALRIEVFQSDVKPLLEAADVEPDEDDCDDCMICKEEFPEFWCETCVKFVCEGCNEETCGESHDFVSTDDLEDDDIDEKWVRARKQAKEIASLEEGVAKVSLS